MAAWKARNADRQREHRRRSDRTRRVRLRRDALILSHLHIPAIIARRYADRPPLLDDLVQEGRLGLIEAAGRFQTGRGAQFATFATGRVRGAILDYIRREGGGRRRDGPVVMVSLEGYPIYG